MTPSRDNADIMIVLDASDPEPGRFDPARFRRPNPADTEPPPVISAEDFEATRSELNELRRRMSRKRA